MPDLAGRGSVPIIERLKFSWFMPLNLIFIRCSGKAYGFIFLLISIYLTVIYRLYFIHQLFNVGFAIMPIILRFCSKFF